MAMTSPSDRRDVVAAHSVLAHMGDEGKVELLFHESAEETAHGVWLPTGLRNDVLNGDARLPSKHLDHGQSGHFVHRSGG